MAGLLPVFIGGLFNYSLNATFKECVKKRPVYKVTKSASYMVKYKETILWRLIIYDEKTKQSNADDNS